MDCSNTGVRGHAGMDHLVHLEDRPWTQRDRKTNKGRGRDSIGQVTEKDRQMTKGPARGLQGQVRGAQGQVGGTQGHIPEGLARAAFPK